MTRTIRGNTLSNRHRKIIKANKNYRGSHSRLFKIANQENMKSLVYSYSNRKKRKNNYKKLWIQKVSGFLKGNTQNKYNLIINKIKKMKILINKKVLAKICQNDQKTFKEIIESK